MRQAGRYLPEYRKIRAQFPDFMEMCKNDEACCEIALQPISRYSLDAAIVFSDILTIPQAMGMNLKFLAKEGPIISRSKKNEKDINEMASPEDTMEKLRYVAKAIRTTKNGLEEKIPLIGFCGSPWTLAAYMVEGGRSRQFNKLRKMVYCNPDLLHKLLQKLSAVCKLYLESQIRENADALMVFDTWGGLLSYNTYYDFSLRYMDDICQYTKKIYPSIPVTFFTKGGSPWINHVAKSSCDGISVDWSISLSDTYLKAPNLAIQGNLDPAQLYGSNKNIEKAVKKIFKDKVHGTRYIFNLGHGIYPDTDPDKVKVLVESVREYGGI
jgi:uroporphyrinogen decarboxylase